MRIVAEDPYEDPEEEPEPESVAAAPGAHVPTVADRGRDWEYRVEVLAIQDVVNGNLATLLTESSAGGWDFLQVVEAGDSRAVLFRKPKAATRSGRAVGFSLPIRA